MWQKYELFSTFFHYFPKFSTIFSTAQLCFFRSIKAFCRHVGSGKPPPPRPLALPHMYSITSSLPSSIICRPSLRRPLIVHHFIDHLSSVTSSITSSTTCRPPLRPSLVHPPIVDHLSSITSSTTYRPSLRPSLVHPPIVDHLSSITSSIICRPSLHLPLLLHHLSPFIIPRLD